MTESQSRSDATRKSEELYELARNAYATAEKRFDDAEGKIGRYLSILFVVLGLATIGVDKYRTIISTAAIPNVVFGVVTAAFYLCGLVAFSCFFRALRVQQVRTLKPGKPVVAYFKKYTLAAALDGLASSFFAAAEQFQHRTKEKLRLVRRGETFLLAVVGLAVVAACSYLFVDLPEDSKMTHATNGGEESESNQSPAEPSSEPSSDSGQAAEDASRLFEETLKGVQDGETREKK